VKNKISVAVLGLEKKLIKAVIALFLIWTLLLSAVSCVQDDSTQAKTDFGADITSEITSEITTEEITEESTAGAAEVTTEEPLLITEEETDTVKKVQKDGSKLNYLDMKAMWLSQFDMNGLYCTGSTQTSESNFRSKIKTVLKNVKSNGFNTVIVQMRPNADSMYPSDVYPMSVYVVGAYGKEAAYDPISIFIEEAHALDLSFHAWINPMRCMTVSQIASVQDRYRLKQWYSSSEYKGKYVVAVGNNYYLNPAYEEVRQLIIDGAKEILEKYDVDGLHMDDYFYPTTDASFDSQAYASYKAASGSLSLADYRRSVLNELVSGLYASVKEKNPDILFGISPAGNINTVYEKQYADVYTWCSSDKYIDYICPQVYFGLEHQTYDFKKVCQTFQNIIKNDNIDLIIGMTLGKAKSKTDQYAGSGKNEWAEHTDILKRCLEYTNTLEKCAGVSYFCYQYFYNPTSGSQVSETRAERNNFIPVLKEISWQ